MSAEPPIREIVGIFHTIADAQAAIDELSCAGFDRGGSHCDDNVHLHETAKAA
jgi:hypothetical protein